MSIRIAASILFRTGKAVGGVRKFRAELAAVGEDSKALRKAADDSNLSISQTLKLMESKRAPSQFQRNIKLTNESIRTFTHVSKEARNWLKRFQSTTRKGVKVRGVRRARRQVKQLGRAAKETRNQFGQLFSALFVGIGGGLGAGVVFGNIHQMFQGAITLAAKDEAALVTFNTMLGSAEKSAKLMDSITQFSAKTPFQRSDIIEGSRTLLRVTRDNVKENERLFKLSASIAALKPGTKVAQTALGIAQATVGEFEILKSFGLVLRAEQFKKAGIRGGTQYAKAVTDEVQRQFAQLTGGRDLVAALSGTLTGKASTLKDNVELIALTMGQTFVKSFGLKGILDNAIGFFRDFNVAITSFLTGEMLPGFDKVSDSIKNFAQIVSNMIKRLGRMVDFGKKLFGTVTEAFSGLGVDTQTTILKTGFAISAIGTAIGIVAPAVIGMGAIFGLLIAALTPLSGLILPAITIGFNAIFLVLAPLLVVLTAMASVFFTFKKDGETVGRTLIRLKDIVGGALTSVFDRLRAIWDPMAAQIVPALVAAWVSLKAAFQESKGPIREFFNLFFQGDPLSQVSDFANIGRRLGQILSVTITLGAWAATKGMKAFTWILRALRPHFKPIASDIMQVGRSLLALITGAESAKTSLKTIFLGIADVILTPVRMLLIKMLSMINEVLVGLAIQVKPFSEKLTSEIILSTQKLQGVQRSLAEGFLATTADIRGAELKVKLDADLVAEATVVQPIEVDGEKVADSLTKVEMRARNSGRGGDPVSPDQLGFVLEGGTRIRPVGLNEVAGEF